ncbi:AraC family transcriptional regulator [Paenibacillus piri]|nr:AraC family transcriptional regulator [Paenibacillus piri]
MNGIHLYESKHTESYKLRVHFHHTYQLLYVIEGQGSVLLDGKTHDLSENSVVVIFPYTKHAVSSNSHLALLILTFNEAALDNMFAPLQRDDISFTGSFKLRLNSLYANETRGLLRKLLFEERQQTMFSDWAMRTYLSEMILVLCRARQSNHTNDFNSLRAEKIRAYIDQHYYESFTSEQLAQKFGVSVRYTNTIFKDKYQMTPVQYLNEVRHGIAKKLLLETDMNIVSICFEVGYESLPTFYRSFKNLVSMSPSQYRQLHRE